MTLHPGHYIVHLPRTAFSYLPGRSVLLHGHHLMCVCIQMVSSTVVQAALCPLSPISGVFTRAALSLPWPFTALVFLQSSLLVLWNGPLGFVCPHDEV